MRARCVKLTLGCVVSERTWFEDAVVRSYVMCYVVISE